MSDPGEPRDPHEHDPTWDAAEWSAQVWDGEKWVDAEEPDPDASGDGEPGDGAPEDDWEVGWEYHEVEHEVEVAREPNRQRQAVIGGGIAITVLLLLAAVVVALGSSEERATTGGTTGTTKGTTVGSTAAPENAPLTGLPGDAAARGRPALIVKIDNVDDGARPQWGVNQADIVFEEKVEGPNSRFAAVFQSTSADKVGPIRSGRTTDIAIASPFDRPLFAFSGANPTFRPLIHEAALVDLGEDLQPQAYSRDGTRQAPHNLVSSTERLWALDDADRPPPSMFTFRTGDEPPKNGRTVAGVRYDWGGGQNGVAFAWNADDKVWERFQNGTPHVDADGVQIAPTNVVLLSVTYVDTGVTDAAGTPVPEAQLEGSGDAWVFSAGQLVQGTWKKSTVDAMPVLIDSDGREITVNRGRTWVALVPGGTPTVANDRSSLGLAS